MSSETTPTNELNTSNLLSTIDQELPISKSTLQRIQTKWKQILSTEKTESLQKQATSLQHYYQTEIQQTNDLISSLTTQFKTCSDQFQHTTLKHIESLQELTSFHKNVMTHLAKDFEAQVQTLQQEKNAERMAILHQYQTETHLLQEEMHQMERQETRAINTHQREQQHALHEIQTQAMKDRSSLECRFENQLEEVEEQAHLAKTEFVHKTCLRADSLQCLQEKHDGLVEEIRLVQQLIERRQSELKQVRQVARRRSSVTMEKSQEIWDRKEAVITRYKDTRLRVEDQRLSHFDKLKGLTKRANRLKSRYEEKLCLMMKICRLAKLAQRMEGDEDSCDHDDGLGDGMDETQSDAVPTCNVEGDGDSQKSASMERNVELVWKKYGRVLLDMKRLDREQDALLRKNQYLKVSS